MTIAEIYDLPINRQREAIRDWHQRTAITNAQGAGRAGIAQRPPDDIIDGYLEAERIRRALTKPRQPRGLRR
ncbi:hypothetical protein GCM10025864_39270 [Luteimicrobium album]|uniref:Uncharacterized protein n=1 Tax=Luteimicrobium album TaxID=1054550 RepID=A0ABQ6I877_9MICO|nr:hypothetical protein [Luteimicrobium album]GMA26168.1 hypothetical protein GCM10025864_39270 [Luteimicrobium album]